MILDGKSLSKKRKELIKEEVRQLIDIYGVTPCLAIVKVGNDPASEIYVRNKIKAATFCQINTKLIELNEETTMDELLSIIDKLNQDIYIHGILVQLPLPSHLDERVIIDRISVLKDVDGFDEEYKQLNTMLVNFDEKRENIELEIENLEEEAFFKENEEQWKKEIINQENEYWREVI